MKSRSAGLFLWLLWALQAESATLNETFASRSTRASGSAIWNQALGKVHPSLQVMNYKAGFTPIEVLVGDGHDGTFDISTYARFSVGGNLAGNIIRFDTDTFFPLEVTSFKLESGWTIEPQGANPLVIYSLSDVLIEGTIACQGGNGTAASGTTPGLGGTGRCGGGNGGGGGVRVAGVGGDGGPGVSPHASVLPGEPGLYNSTPATPAVSGGGGGAWSSAPTDGALAGAFGGGAGQSFPDAEFSVEAGGAGGGGGAWTTNFGGGAGSGGGAGGGAVIIHAVRDVNLGSPTDNTVGLINVNGGQGGGIGTSLGGAGGGGGGGSVKVFAGGTINIYNDTEPSGASQANSGTGGTNSSANNGGNGGPGRSWYISNQYNGVGFYTPVEQAPLVPGVGAVEYNPAAQSVESSSFDLAATFTKINSLTLSPSSSEFKFEVAGSADNFVSDNTGFTENVDLISNKRYLKFRITLTGGDVNNPNMVDTATISYLAGQREDFVLQAAGCGRVTKSSSGFGDGLAFALVFLFLATLKFQAQRQKSIRAQAIVRAAQ